MTQLPDSATPRHGERGEALTLAVIFLLVFLGFILLVAFMTQNQRAAADAEGGGHSGSDSDEYAASDDSSDLGPLVLAHGCIIFARHPRVTPGFITKVVQIAAPLPGAAGDLQRIRAHRGP